MHAVRHVSLASVSVRAHAAYGSYRQASLTSAISAGVRKTATALRNAETWRRQQTQDESKAQDDEHDRNLVRRTSGFQSRDRARDQHLAFLRHGSEAAGKDAQSNMRTTRESSPTQKKSSVPVAVPFTTAGSEFVYGTHSVLAALRAGRRSFYKLYIYVAQNELASASDLETPEIVRLAKRYGLQIERVAGDWLRLLDKMSDRRPHNGIVLEASPLPVLRALELLPIVGTDQPVKIGLDAMSQEEKQIANIVGDSANEETKHVTIEKSASATAAPPDAASKHRFPLLLWLDRITDTGNLGAILRTVHYFDVDGVIVPNHGTAPLSAVTVKASAGAAELVPILIVKDEKSFITKSKANGWKLLAAVSAQSTSKKHAKKSVLDHDFAADTLRHSPCILALGSEADGLRPWMVSEADHHLTIKGAQPKDDIVDSLNVSVAAALLIDRMLPTQFKS